MTYEEISTKYPVGKLLASEIIYIDRTGYYVNEADKEFYLTNYHYVRFYPNNYVEYKEKQIKKYVVQGWLVTDEGFFVAEDTWDGWQPLDEDDLAEIEAKGFAVTEF